METKLSSKNEIHLLRKLWHALTGFLIILSVIHFKLSSTQICIITGVILFLGVGLELLRLKNHKVNQFIVHHARSLMRESEHSRPTGAAYYALGILLSFLFFPKDIALLSLLSLAFADPFASFIGVTLGRHQLIKGKSLEGTLAGFFASGISLYLALKYAHLWSLELNNLAQSGPDKILILSFTGALFSTMGELGSKLIDDNLTIPLATGLGLSLVL